MERIAVRVATLDDVAAILELFLERFPFLQEVADKARQDVINRVTKEDSVTVVAVLGGEIVGVARGYENKEIYLMNSICTSSALSLVNSGRTMLALLPFFMDTCISHSKKLGLTKAFYGTQVGSLASLVPKLCMLKGYTLEPGSHGGEEGFWIVRGGRSE